MKNKILIVDNESLNLAVLTSILIDDYDIKGCTSCAESLEILKNDKTFDLLLISRNLPDTEFFEFIKSVTQNDSIKGCQFIITSDSIDEKVFSFAFDCGCIDYITKPFLPVLVKKKVENAISSGYNEKVSKYDDLTGLFNRSTFYKNIEKSTGYIISLNIKNFSRVNTRYGFEKGDTLLVVLSDLLKKYFADGCISRFDNDHFYIFTDDRSARTKLNDISCLLKRKYPLVNIHLQSGVYCRRNITVSIREDCDRAFRACKKIDDNYSLSFINYEDIQELNDGIETFIIDNFDSAMSLGYIKLSFQSIVRSFSNNLCSMEVFARWTDPKLGSIRPLTFISVLEKYSLVHKLDLYVIEEVCREYIPYLQSFSKVVPVSINLSTIDFELCDMVEEIEVIMRKYNVDSRLLSFEISCQKSMHNAEKTLKELERLKSYGHTIILDNFGKGTVYTNDILEYGNVISIVKVDMKYLKRLKDKDKSLLAHTVDILKRNGYQITAQGVETKNQCSFLMEIGCERLQGNFFSKPGSIKNCIKNSIIERVEDSDLNEYYKAIGKINLLSINPIEQLKNTSFFEDSLPMAIVELTDNKFHYISATDSFREAFKTIGIKNLKELEDRINRRDEIYYNSFIRMARISALSHKTERMDMAQKGFSVSFMIRLISKYKYAQAFLVCMFGVTKVRGVETNSKEIDPVFLYDNLPVSHLVLEVVPDFDLKTSRDIIFRYFNQTFIEDRIDSREMLIGRSFYDLYPDESPELGEICYKCVYEKDEQKGLLYFQKSDSWVYYLAEPCGYPGCCSVILWKADHDLIKRLSSKKNEVIETVISRCIKLMSNTEDYSSTMNDLMEVLAKTLKAQKVYIIEIKDKNVENTFCYSSEGSIGRSIKMCERDKGRKEIVIVNNIESLKEKEKECYEFLKKLDIESVIKVPLIENGKILGYLGVDNFSVEHKMNLEYLLEVIGGFISCALYTHRLMEDMHLAGQRDSLTGLLNRSAMNDYSAEAEKKHDGIGVIFVDINGLKKCNDEYGHAAGDLLIKNTAELLKTIFEDRHIFRVGGDEFMIIITPVDEAVFYSKVDTLHTTATAAKDLKIAIGYEWNKDSSNIDVITRIADERMYTDKNNYYKKHDRRAN